MKDNLLEVGDILYQWNRWHGYSKVTVIKVTEKQAVLSHACRCVRTKRETKNKVEFRAIGEGYDYELETEELKDKYERKRLVSTTRALKQRFNDLDMSNYPSNLLTEIINFITPFVTTKNT